MSIRQRVIKASASLMARNVLGMVIGTAGVFLLTSTIGPAAFGEYVAVFGVATFATAISSLGVSVYLVRKEQDPTPEILDQAFTLLAVTGSIAAALLIAGVPLLSDWMNVEGIEGIAIALFLLCPFSMISTVPLAMIERRLNYGRVAVVELLGQVMIYAVALPAAFMDMGSWAPALGWIAHRLFLSATLLKISGYRPRFHWDITLIKEILAYGISFSASNWLWSLRKLINPMIVTRYAGVEVVAYISLAIRFIEALSFVKNITWRISVAAFAKMQSDTARLSSAVREGMEYQVLLVAPMYLGFSIAGPWLIGMIYDDRWQAVMTVFPFIAAGYLVNAVFNLHCSALYVVRRNLEVGLFHLTHVILFGVTALILVPRIGIVGYGWGEVVGIASYVVVYWYSRQFIGPISQNVALYLTLAFSLALFWPLLGPVAWSGLGLALLWPAAWKSAYGLMASAKKLIVSD